MIWFVFALTLSFNPLLSKNSHRDYVTERIYQDCRESILSVNEGSFLGAFGPILWNEYEKTIPYAWEIKNPTKAQISDILGFLNHFEFRRIGVLGGMQSRVTFVEGQRFEDKIIHTRDGVKYEIPIDGEHVFYCNNKFLNISSTDLIWGGEFLEPKKYFVSIIIDKIPINLTIGQFTLLSVSFPTITVLIWEVIRKYLSQKWRLLIKK